MTEITLNTISGFTFPYDVYVCNVYQTNCVFLATINSNVPPSVNIVLPTPFNTAPAIGLKIIESNGCEKFKIINCNLL